MRDTTRDEYEEAFDKVHDTADKAARESAEDGDTQSVVEDLNGLAEKRGYTLTGDRKEELYNIARDSGRTIREAAEDAGMSPASGYRHEQKRKDSHGEKVSTRAEKERLVSDYLAEHPNASNREVSRATGVSHPTVAAIRQRINDEAAKNRIDEEWQRREDEEGQPDDDEPEDDDEEPKQPPKPKPLLKDDEHDAVLDRVTHMAESIVSSLAFVKPDKLDPDKAEANAVRMRAALLGIGTRINELVEQALTLS